MVAGWEGRDGGSKEGRGGSGGSGGRPCMVVFVNNYDSRRSAVVRVLYFLSECWKIKWDLGTVDWRLC